jgi:hypothetical protein
MCETIWRRRGTLQTMTQTMAQMAQTPAISGRVQSRTSINPLYMPKCCCICYDPVRNSQKKHMCTTCALVSHHECVVQWYAMHSLVATPVPTEPSAPKVSCPNCRQMTLLSPPLSEISMQEAAIVIRTPETVAPSTPPAPSAPSAQVDTWAPVLRRSDRVEFW